MTTVIAVLASVGFIGWFIYRAIKQRQVKAHAIAYRAASVTGIFTIAFFLRMDIPQLVKIMVSILLGMTLIVVVAYFQRRRQAGRQ